MRSRFRRPAPPKAWYRLTLSLEFFVALISYYSGGDRSAGKSRASCMTLTTTPMVPAGTMALALPPFTKRARRTTAAIAAQRSLKRRSASSPRIACALADRLLISARSAAEFEVLGLPARRSAWQAHPLSRDNRSATTNALREHSGSRDVEAATLSETPQTRSPPPVRLQRDQS